MPFPSNNIVPLKANAMEVCSKLLPGGCHIFGKRPKLVIFPQVGLSSLYRFFLWSCLFSTIDSVPVAFDLFLDCFLNSWLSLQTLMFIFFLPFSWYCRLQMPFSWLSCKLALCKNSWLACHIHNMPPENVKWMRDSTRSNLFTTLSHPIHQHFLQRKSPGELVNI